MTNALLVHKDVNETGSSVIKPFEYNWLVRFNMQVFSMERNLPPLSAST